MSGQRSGTDPGADITGSCKTEQHLTRLTSTSTFSPKSFVEGSSLVNRQRGTTGHHTVRTSILLAPLSGDLLRTKDQQQQAVTDVAATIPIEKLRNAAQNVRKRAKACIKAYGGHFKHFL